MAAYGTAPDDRRRRRRSSAKRDAARAIVDPLRPTRPAIAGRRSRLHVQHRRLGGDANGVTTTGLDDVDLWVGGLAEVTNLFGGLLGSTFNYVFQTSWRSCRTSTGSTTWTARRA